MNADQLKAYKRDKSKKFNAHLRDLRLKEKENKKIADQQPDNQQPDNQHPDNQDDNTIDKQDDLQGNQLDDNLTLQDVMDIFSTLDTKLDLLESKIETIIETKMYETLDTKMDIIQTKLESIIETKLETKLETKQPQPNSIFFA